MSEKKPENPVKKPGGSQWGRLFRGGNYDTFLDYLGEATHKRTSKGMAQAREANFPYQRYYGFRLARTKEMSKEKPKNPVKKPKKRRRGYRIHRGGSWWDYYPHSTPVSDRGDPNIYANAPFGRSFGGFRIARTKK